LRSLACGWRGSFRLSVCPGSGKHRYAGGFDRPYDSCRQDAQVYPVAQKDDQQGGGSSSGLDNRLILRSAVVILKPVDCSAGFLFP
jgi:hypothetical protein